MSRLTNMDLMGADTKADYSWIGQTGSALGNVFGSVFGKPAVTNINAPAPSLLSSPIIPVAILGTVALVGLGVFSKRKRKA